MIGKLQTLFLTPLLEILAQFLFFYFYCIEDLGITLK
ncbi:Uncharacterised protein [Streptococcus pneumoniae]|nr:Uncharacterised protein [Streptococcus pneumoniae]